MTQEKIKSYFYIALIVSVLLVSFSVWSYVSFYGKSIQPSSFRSFAVTGDGKAVGIPDVAVFDFSVVTEGGEDMGALQTANTESANKAIAYVKSKGVESKDIKTTRYSIDPRYQYCGRESTVCPPPTLVGYTITQSVEVKIRDFTKIGDILSGVVKNGANSVSGFQFTIDDMTKVQDEARAEAITKAKTKAETIAEAGGFSIGRLLSIEEGGNYPQPMYYGATKGMGVVESAPSPVIEPGSQELQVTVTLRYEIK